MSKTSQTSHLLDWQEAASYCGLDPRYLRVRVRQGHGPAYLKPSQRTVLFRQTDLDAWLASWPRVEPKLGEQPAPAE